MFLAGDDQGRRAAAFVRLHEGSEAFVIANPWDAGTAGILTGLGFPALATTSAGLAFSLGRGDGANLVSREEALVNARAIVAATHLPVSGDLESGYGASPEEVAVTIRLGAEAGLVGASVEDATGDPRNPVHPLEVAVERVSAAVEAARSLPFPFTLTARAENFLYGRADLDDTIRRLQAYEAAGADVLYAPALPDLEAIRTVCASVTRPVNVLASRYPVSELSACGAHRISLGSALSRAALTAVTRAAREVLDQGTFEFARDTLPYSDANTLMAPDRRDT